MTHGRTRNRLGLVVSGLLLWFRFRLSGLWLSFNSLFGLSLCLCGLAPSRFGCSFSLSLDGGGFLRFRSSWREEIRGG